MKCRDMKDVHRSGLVYNSCVFYIAWFVTFDCWQKTTTIEYVEAGFNNFPLNNFIEKLVVNINCNAMSKGNQSMECYWKWLQLYMSFCCVKKGMTITENNLLITILIGVIIIIQDLMHFIRETKTLRKILIWHFIFILMSFWFKVKISDLHKSH